MSAEKCIVMAIKPKYAKAIYAGEKNWEFRKMPPPLCRIVYLYESEPVSAVTGWVAFCESITGAPECVWDHVTTSRCWPKNLLGITKEELLTYAEKRFVTALRVYDRERLPHPVKFSGTPPMNWGHFPCEKVESEVSK